MNNILKINEEIIEHSLRRVACPSKPCIDIEKILEISSRSIFALRLYLDMLHRALQAGWTPRPQSDTNNEKS